MSYVHEGWVAFPQFLFLKGQGLQYQDAIIYASIRSFLNTSTDECFPAYETIADRAGVSKSFVIKSVKRLKRSGLIEVVSSKKSKDKNNPNKYSFKEIDCFEQIPMSFFDDEDSTYTEKAMLLCIRQFFNHGILTSLYSIKTMAELLGLTYRKVHAQITRLIDKGYLVSDPMIKKGKVISKDRWKLTGKIRWIYGQTKSNSYFNTIVQFPRLVVS